MHIVKRKGHKEEYDQKKVYASVYASCMSLRMHEQEAELIADKVTKEVNNFAATRKEITSHEIFVQINENLSRYNPEAAFLYRTHLDIS